MTIDQKSLEKITKMAFSIVAEYMSQFYEYKEEHNLKTPSVLTNFGFLLDRFEPEESRSALKRILLKMGQSVETQIREETESCGWYYAELSPNANKKILGLLKIGYEFEGSDSEQLYESLNDYVSNFADEGFVFDNLWDVCYYLDILLNLYNKDLGREYNRYNEQIRYCALLLEEGLTTARMSKQLKAYVIWLLHRVSESEIAMPSLKMDMDLFLDEINGSSLMTSLWILFVCFEIGVSTSKMEKALKVFISDLKEEDLWKESTRSAFLAFTSSLLRRSNTYLTIPYATFLSTETPFFGVVAETLLKAILDLEKEKKTMNFDENSLRNRFLAVLKSRFDGVAYAEAFRCNGLTDITVANPKNHYEEIVIECKIWRGPKYYHEAIEQAMGYLTKKDERIIILIFFMGDESNYELKRKLEDAIKSEENLEALSDGIASLSLPPFFCENQLYSLHRRKDRYIGIHHIFTSIGKV